MMQDPPLVADLVLIGGGHAHALVLKMLGMPKLRRIVVQNGIRITLITKDIHTPYSGMLPGFVSGHYTMDQIHLDLCKLSRFANVRLVHAAAVRITYDDDNRGGGMVYCSDDHPPIRYDCLSIDIGSAPARGDHVYRQNCRTGGCVIPVKPISNFCRFYQSLTRKWETKTSSSSMSSSTSSLEEQPSSYTLCVVGGGAGGIELALSMQYKLSQMQSSLQQNRQQHHLKVILVTRGKKLLESHNRGVQRIFARILQERQIDVYYGAEVLGIEPVSGTKQKRLVLSSTSTSTLQHAEPIIFDDCIWCITAGVSSWLADATPFATTETGFLRVNDTYESIHHPGVFAAGDCCHMDRYPRPKAGVFAVRAGPYLCDNLIRYLLKQPLKSHRPQKDFLGLISTGDKYAVASKGSWCWMEGKWLWTVKDWIDGRFMEKFSDLPDLEEMMATVSLKRSAPRNEAFLRTKGADVWEAFSAVPMRCGGCGAKVGARTVSRVLKAVYKRQAARAAEHNLAPPPPIYHDDAAVMPLPKLIGKDGGAIIQTIDYFRELLSDPFLFGKVVAAHSLSDIHAMGAVAQSALVLAVAPFAADEAMTESTLLHLLSGVSDILQDEGVKLIGGHTCEGQELACGLSVQGYTDDSERLLRKRGGKVGDKIVLTKPLGTGALFAADMRAKARGEYVMEAIDSMIKSNRMAASVAMQFDDVHSCTDVTGFGLIGHLLEMLMANEEDRSMDRIGAVLDIEAIPFLRGGLEASKMGIFSSLQPENSRNRRAVINHSDAANSFPVKYPLLFDPQTAGGLLFFVDPKDCDEFVLLLQAEKVTGSIIGELVQFPEPGQSVEGGTCTIGSGDAVTGQRIRIEW